MKVKAICHFVLNTSSYAFYATNKFILTSTIIKEDYNGNTYNPRKITLAFKWNTPRFHRGPLNIAFKLNAQFRRPDWQEPSSFSAASHFFPTASNSSPWKVRERLSEGRKRRESGLTAARRQHYIHREYLPLAAEITAGDLISVERAEEIEDSWLGWCENFAILAALAIRAALHRVAETCTRTPTYCSLALCAHHRPNLPRNTFSPKHFTADMKHRRRGMVTKDTKNIRKMPGYNRWKTEVSLRGCLFLGEHF